MKPKRPRHTAVRRKAVKAGYRSGLEQAIATDLKERGIAFEFESKTIEYTLPVRRGRCGKCGSNSVGKGATYKPDFSFPGRSLLVESKGYFTARDRSKLAAVRIQHPGINLRILFAANNFCTKLHKQRYVEWAHKHGYVAAIGKKIPAEWLAV